MFEKIKYWAELKKLEEKQQKLLTKYCEAAKKPITKDTDGELSYLDDEAEKLATSLDYLQTKRLLKICEMLGIQTPDFKDRAYYYQYNSYDHEEEYNILTHSGFVYVRGQIKKERRETIVFWSGLVFGVIGALTGLIAVYLN